VSTGRPVLTLEELRARTAPVSLSGERTLPVRDDLGALLPGGGWRRGSVVEITSPSLLFVGLADALAQGSWAALVGVSGLGLAAAIDHGVSFDRLAVVVAPPPDLAATVVAALVDAVDFVVVGAGVISRSTDARRLVARARERGAVLIAHGRWPDAVDVRLSVTAHRIDGLGAGHGHLSSWAVEVDADGRGAAARHRHGVVTLAAPS
jgi:hypothetical protein